MIVAATLAQGCASQSAPTPTALPPAAANDESSASGERVVATVTGYPIAVSMADLQGPLMQAYGLQLLVNIVTLDLAREEARKLGYTCSEVDFAAERQHTLDLLQKETMQQTMGESSAQPYVPTTQESEDLLQKVLDQQHITQEEFRLTLETDAYLRKIAEPQIRQKMTDDQVRERFNAMYGEKISIRHIVCANMMQVRAVELRLKRGDGFAEVAREMSVNARTAPLGGQLPPFTRQDPSLPETFKQVAFALKIGEVSEPVRVEDTFQLIKLEDRIPPKIVKFEDYKDDIRQQMFADATRALMQQYHTELGGIARTRLRIQDPMLAAQFADIMATAKVELTKEQQARRWDEARRRMASTQPTPDASSPDASDSALPTDAGGSAGPSAPGGVGSNPNSPSAPDASSSAGPANSAGPPATADPSAPAFQTTPAATQP
jgi:foldase protein PrsA